MTLTTNDILKFPGTWRCCYWYPNTKPGGREETSEYTVKIDRHEDGYVVHSIGSDAPGAHLEARFTVDGSLVTGTFMENTSPSGDWEGMTYKGAFQLVMNDEHTHMEGMWVAAGYNNGKPKVFTGHWELVQVEG